MPNYLYIFRGGDMRNMSPQQMQDNMAKWNAWIGQLSQVAQYKAGDPLNPDGKVVAGKKRAVTDGPYGETKDVVGGYIIVTAPNMQAGTELAHGCPILEGEGSVEIREVRPMVT